MSRVLAAYVALVLMVAMVGPGLAVYGAEGDAEVVSEPAVEAAPEEVVEAAPEEVVEASIEIGPATIVAASDVVIAAIVPGDSTNLALTFQGVRKSFGWTTGNLQTWYEGQWVPYRLIIENKDDVNSVSVPTISVTLDHFTGTGIMYDETRLWGYYFTDDTDRSDTWYPATTALAPLSQDVPIDPPIWGTASLIKTTFAPDEIVVPPGQIAVLYFQAHLAVTSEWNLADPPRNGAGYVSGSSGHGQLDMTGVGAKTVPTPSVPQPAGSLAVYKFQDDNEDGIHDVGEVMLEGWAFTLFDSSDTEVASGSTDANGQLLFGGVAAGDHSVTETLQNGWVNTTPLTQAVEVVANETAELWFGNIPEVIPPETGDLLIHKFEDTNENGVHDEGEATLEDWAFTLYDGEDAEIDSGLTDANGELLFTELVVGMYSVTETLQNGWVNTTPLTQGIEVVANQTAELWFGNIPEVLPPETGDLLIHKFEDTNENGVHDEGEAMLEDWEFMVTLETPPLEVMSSAVMLIGSGFTDAAGELAFTELVPGEYHITETLQDGWTNTTPLTQIVDVVAGETTHVWFGNVEEFMPFTELDLAIIKLADKETASEGELITYTLTYWNLGDLAAENFTIVDDYDERYVTVVNAAGGTVAGGKITWTIPGPLAKADGMKTIIYTMRVIADMPTGTTNIDNVVVISHPQDSNPANNTANERVIVRVVDEPFLPFTGGEYLLLLGFAVAAAAIGLLLRPQTDNAV